MRFIETPVFTKEVRSLQTALVLRPEQGQVIPGSGGLRKIRWKAKSRGKRGGLRVIYYWITSENAIYMLLVYEKSAQEELTPAQAKVLRRLVQEELG